MRITVLHNHPIHYKNLLFTAFARLGQEIDVVFAARSSTSRTTELQPTGESYRSHFLSDGPFEALPQISTAVRAVRAMTRCRPEVVIIGGYSYLAAWSTLAWAKLNCKPVVLWSESNFFDRRRRALTESVKKMFVRGCDAAHVYGKSNRSYLEYLGMQPAAIIEKRAAVDWCLFSKRRAKFHTEFRRFIYVGRFSPEKNLPRLLEAFRIVRGKRRSELVLVGYGQDEQLLKHRMRDLALDDSVFFAGPKTQDEVSSMLAECDCLVLPSMSEPWGLVANEALSAGLPVILSNRCGCALDLVTRETGWTFEAENTEELAQRMIDVCDLSLEDLRERGQAAARLALEYTPESVAKRLLANLEELVKRRRTSGGF